MSTSRTNGLIRFGVFELDLAARQLRKNGARIKLQEQPFRVLQMLVERPGEVVTRDELKEKLWSADTFVEFDHSLNTAIQKIRTALRDSADNPRFIETVPRLGYRFLAPTEGSAASTLPAEGDSREFAEPPAVERARRRRLSWIAVSAALLATAGLTWWLARSMSPAPDSRPQFKLTQLTSDSGLTFEPAISADGTLVAYASDRAGEGGIDIWVQQASGGGAVRLTDHEADDRFPTFSPDGGRIAFRSERDGGGIYVMPALGGDARLIAERGLRPRFSPDGKLVAYYTGEQSTGSLFVVPADGGAATRLAVDFEGASRPIWLPDGKHLLFIGYHHAEGRDWWVAPIMGGAIVNTGADARLTEGGLTPGALSYSLTPEAWHAEANAVVFSTRSGGSTNLWRIPISPETWKVAGSPQRLTFGTGTEGQASMALGGRIAFSSLLLNQDVWALPIDPNAAAASGELERVTTSPASDGGPSVSSDGRRLVFRSNRSGDWSIWSKDLDTGKETALTTPNPAYGPWPVISPDGSKVAYTLGQGRGSSIHVLAIDQHTPQTLCEGCGGAPRSWSSDGSMILHQREYERTIHLWDVASGERTEILGAQPNPASPRFSFDDRWITFMQPSQPDRSRLLVAEFQGRSRIPEQDWIAVTSGEFHDNKPRWSPDGNLVYFTSTRDGFACIWAVRLHPATKRPVGEPFAVRHFHRTRLSMSLYALSGYELSVARDKLVFELTELTGNIWMLEPESGE